MAGLLNPEFKPSRNAFDLSHGKLITMKFGELLPILNEEVIPGDYFEISLAYLLRTMPLNTAAFFTGKVHFDFFYVPMRSMWHQFDSFIYQREQHGSSYQRGSGYLPNVTIGELENMVSDHGSDAMYGTASSRKLLSLLGYGNLANSTVDTISSRSLSIMPLGAYHQIFNHYYRDSWHDEIDNAAEIAANFDFLACDTYANSLFDNTYQAGSDEAYNLVSMHYKGWNKDIFMGALPNQQFGSVSVLSSDVSVDSLSNYGTSNVVNVLASNSSGLIQRGSINSSSDTNPANFTPAAFTSLSGSATASILELRKAEALQRWKEYNMRAGWKAKHQQKAMFGVDGRRLRNDEPDFIGSFDYSLMIDAVTSTSNTSDPTSTTSNGNLGELGGKGISANATQTVKYNVTDHGYIMCIAYLSSENVYDGRSIDKQLVRSEADSFANPLFDRLGMEAVQAYELKGSYGNAATFDTVLGYAPSYHEYKTRVTKAYGPFITGGTLQSWVATRRDMVDWANTGTTFPVDLYYQNPSIADSLFAVAADDSLDTDQLLLDVEFKTTAVRPLSVLGLPTF